MAKAIESMTKRDKIPLTQPVAPAAKPAAGVLEGECELKEEERRELPDFVRENAKRFKQYKR